MRGGGEISQWSSQINSLCKTWIYGEVEGRDQVRVCRVVAIGSLIELTRGDEQALSGEDQSAAFERG